MNFFDKSEIYIVTSKSPELVLRTVDRPDLEYLRQWKNAQKEFFFHQEEITENQQKQWYESFKKSPYDLMLMVEYRQQLFGCMGIRWKESHWDVYNVILGLQEYGKRGFMGAAFAAMLNLAGSIKPAPIGLQVLKNNPAVQWYQKQGFEVMEIHDSFFFMMFNLKK